MKHLKWFFLFLILISELALNVYAVEEKVEGYKSQEAVSKPASPEDAYRMKERYQETLKEYNDNEGRPEAKVKDSIDSIKELIAKKKADLAKRGGLQIEADIAQLEVIKQANEYLQEPDVQSMIDEYTASLAAGFEGPVQVERSAEKPAPTKLTPVAEKEQKKLPLGTELWSIFKSWVQESRVRIYDWLGNKQKVQEIRTDLDNIHTSLGDKNLVASAQNKAELAKIQNLWGERLRLGTEALDAYKKALDKGVGDQKTIKEEAQEIIIDLMQLRQELKTFEAEEKEIKKSVGIDSRIDKILNDFGISGDQVKKLEKQAIEALTKKLLAKRQAIEKQLADAQFEKTVLDPVELGKFKYQVDQLVGRDISKLPLEEQGRINLALVEAYKRPSDVLWQELQNPDLNKNDRPLVLDRFLKFNNDYINVEKRYADWFERYIKERGKTPATLPEQKPVPQRFVESMKKSLELVTTAMLNNLISEKYAQLKEKIEQFQKVLEQAAVTSNSLEARKYLLTEVYGKIVNGIFRREGLQPTEQLVKIFADATAKIGETSEQLALDQAATIVESPGGGLSVEVPVAPPPPAPPTPSQPFEEEKPTEKPDDLLAAIRAGTTLRSAAARKLPEQKEKVGDLMGVLSDALNQKFRGAADDEIQAATDDDDDDWN